MFAYKAVRGVKKETHGVPYLLCGAPEMIRTCAPIVRSGIFKSIKCY